MSTPSCLCSTFYQLMRLNLHPNGIMYWFKDTCAHEILCTVLKRGLSYRLIRYHEVGSMKRLRQHKFQHSNAEKQGVSINNQHIAKNTVFRFVKPGYRLIGHIMSIRTTLVSSVAVCVLISQALSVPVEREPVVSRNVQEKDGLEDELRLQSGDTESPTKVNTAITRSKEDKFPEQLERVSDAKLDQDDIYDLTVGDVIRDVLFTLREHPEIVKELIESERRKLMEKMTSVTTDVKTGSEKELETGQVSSPGDMTPDFQYPPEHLISSPKKAGYSGMSEPASTAVKGNENVGEAIDTKNDHSVVNYVPDVPLLHLLPKEGGQEDPMFDYERKQKTLSEHEKAGENDDVKSNDSYKMQTNEDSEQGTKNIVNYKLPYINPLPFFPASYFSNKMNSLTDRMKPNPHANDISSEVDQTREESSDQSIKPETADSSHAQAGKQENIPETSVKSGINESTSRNKQVTSNEVSSSENLDNKAASLSGIEDKAEMELFSLLQKVASKQKAKMQTESVM